MSLADLKGAFRSDDDKGSPFLVSMCSSLLQLAPGSRDLYQAEKRQLFCKDEKIHKMTLKIVLDEKSCHFE